MSKYILINFIQDLKDCREGKTYFLSSVVSNKLAIDILLQEKNTQLLNSHI